MPPPSSFLIFFLLVSSLGNEAAGVRDLKIDDTPIAGGNTVSIPAIVGTRNYIPNTDDTLVSRRSPTLPPRNQGIVSKSPPPLPPSSSVTIEELDTPDKPDLPSCLPQC